MDDPTTLFLAGDVMLGRGVDQVFGRSVDPELHESHVRDAREYVALAEDAHGPIPAPVEPGYPWGDALADLERIAPEARIVNLETALTTSDRPWPGKGIHYRCHPENVSSLSAAGVDCCVLANNHVLDWEREGLSETLATLDRAGIARAGAGGDRDAAGAPAILGAADGRRVLVFGLGAASSGIPGGWDATAARSGVRLLPDLSDETLESVAGRVEARRRPGDLVVASLHWGPNWGYGIPERRRRFARGLVDRAGVDAVHGHSSHHPLGLEVYRGRPILYGCGDFVNDYEGIGGRERFRGDLACAYLPAFDEPGGPLRRFRILPYRIRRFRLEAPPVEDVSWLARRLDRESRPLGARVRRVDDRVLSVEWG